METAEVRDPAAARTYVLQGLWLRGMGTPTAGTVRPALRVLLAIAADGHVLPPPGFVADLVAVVFGRDGHPGTGAVELPGWPPTLSRSYEDQVLGKIAADSAFDRASAALGRYPEQHRPRGLAYMVGNIRERTKQGGVMLPTATVRGLLVAPTEELVAEGYDSLAATGPVPLLIRQYEGLIAGFRMLGEVLGPEDVIALEQRTALADLSNYVAHRQILQVAARLESTLPERPVRPAAGRREVPTRVADDDRYPVGGYSSISTRGSVESLLHSQLAYMEPESPDLFDAKFVRDELFYYSRDENQFHRRRRTFAFALFPDLTDARYKDAELPVQRVVFILSVILVLVRRLTEWLSADSLRFEVLFVSANGANPMAHEEELLRLLLREPVERGSAAVRVVPSLADLENGLSSTAHTCQLHCLTLSVASGNIDVPGVVVTRLAVPGPRPALTDGNGTEVPLGGEDAADCWSEAVGCILSLWV